MPQQSGYLPGTVGSVPAGLLGIDTDTKLDTTHIQELAAAGYTFIMRYISLNYPASPSGDLDYDEAQNIVNAGLGLMPVQHPRLPGWTPTPTMGTIDGENARDNAYHVGFPAHVNVWLDLEGINQGTSAATVIDYCNNWYDAVAAWGYIPGIYVGANCLLTGDQLYYDLKFGHYWQSLSSVPTPSVRGYQMIQSAAQSYYCVPIDRDTTQMDSIGGQVQWLHQ